MSARVDPASVGDVGKPHRACAVLCYLKIVAEQAALEGQRPDRLEQRIAELLARSHHVPLDEKHIKVAVIVVVQQTDAGRHDLREVEFARHAVEVHEVEAGGVGLIGEPIVRAARVRSRGASLWRRAAALRGGSAADE